MNLTVDGAVEELFIDDLHPGVTYEFLLLAFNIKGNGNYSDPITVTTSEEGRGMLLEECFFVIDIVKVMSI